MATARKPGTWRAILLTITICSFSYPVYAKYGGGMGEPNDPYQIATADGLTWVPTAAWPKPVSHHGRRSQCRSRGYYHGADEKPKPKRCHM